MLCTLTDASEERTEEPQPDEQGVIKVWGNLVGFVERLDDEMFKSLQVMQQGSHARARARCSGHRLLLKTPPSPRCMLCAPEVPQYGSSTVQCSEAYDDVSYPHPPHSAPAHAYTPTYHAHEASPPSLPAFLPACTLNR
jgi:Eukaryotic translation initiation factor 3 subunit 8 N-terminus